MLLDSFYTIDRIDSSDDTIIAALTLNPSHAIFSGHFPGQPVVPGVVMMQIVRELVEKHFNRRFQVAEADQLKFLSIIDPNQTPLVHATVNIAAQGESKVINASLSNDPVTYFKMKAVLKPT